MLEAERLTIAVDNRALLADVDFAVRPGCIAAIIGPNGAGKTTLLRALAGELAPTGGDVRLDGRDLRALRPVELARRRAVVPQASVLAFPFTVAEVVMLGVTVPGFGAPGPAAAAAAREALDAVAMTPFASRLYGTLSGGERQRVHIARALCQLATAPHLPGETRCLLLDEPTSSLDLAHQVHVLAALRRQAARGTAVVAVLHDLNLAAALADALILLAGGRVAAVGPPAQVLDDDLLTRAYGCTVRTNRVPDGGQPFVLPPAAFARSPALLRPLPAHHRAADGQAPNG
jgi:iron complex transport system ATP-binding protein